MIVVEVLVFRVVKIDLVVVVVESVVVVALTVVITPSQPM